MTLLAERPPAVTIEGPTASIAFDRFDLDAYQLALTQVAAAGVPLPVVVQHLKHGLTPGQSCGGCDHWRELWVRGIHRICSLAFSQQSVPSATVACGKFRTVGT